MVDIADPGDMQIVQSVSTFGTPRAIALPLPDAKMPLWRQVTT